jgi:hypothetical protein
MMCGSTSGMTALSERLQHTLQASDHLLRNTTWPTVRFGKPRKPDQHTLRQIQGVDVFVPHTLPSLLNLSIRAKHVPGRKYLFIKGWKLA